MATADQFRRLATSLPGVEEKSHIAHPDFRVGGRIFATLGAPDPEWGMVKLKPGQQDDFIALAPEAFKPAAGAWGRGGSTLVKLSAVGSEMLEAALESAWMERSACRR